MKIVFQRSPTLQEIEYAVNKLQDVMKNSSQYPWQKIKVLFNKETEVRVDRFNKKTFKEMKVIFFTGRHNGSLCYTFHKSSGYYLECSIAENIASLSIEAKDVSEKQIIDEVRKLGSIIHPNAWDDLKKNIDVSPQEYIYHGLARINIICKFPSLVIDNIKSAFENRTPYHYSKNGEKRDLSVSTSVGDDGIFRAWFSSEFSGCGNGSYYLLLNPTTASFREDD